MSCDSAREGVPAADAAEPFSAMLFPQAAQIAIRCPLVRKPPPRMEICTNIHLEPGCVNALAWFAGLRHGRPSDNLRD